MIAFIAIAAFFLMGLAIAVVLAERSVRRQSVSEVRRTPEEDRATGRMLVGLSHWRGSGG